MGDFGSKALVKAFCLWYSGSMGGEVGVQYPPPPPMCGGGDSWVGPGAPQPGGPAVSHAVPAPPQGSGSAEGPQRRVASGHCMAPRRRRAARPLGTAGPCVCPLPPPLPPAPQASVTCVSCGPEGQRTASEATPGAVGQAVEGVAKAVGGGYCRLQMPWRPALGVRGTVAGHRLGALEGGGRVPPSNASLLWTPPLCTSEGFLGWGPATPSYVFRRPVWLCAVAPSALCPSAGTERSLWFWGICWFL